MSGVASKKRKLSTNELIQKMQNPITVGYDDSDEECENTEISEEHFSDSEPLSPNAFSVDETSSLNQQKNSTNSTEPSPSVNSAKKSTKGQPKKPRFRWTNQKIESLIKCLLDVKTKYEFQCKDFEKDLIQSYSEVRVKMAQLYDRKDFGPVEETAIEDCLSTDLVRVKALIAEDKALIKTGYERIKHKIKCIRQEYRNAVSMARRSGSGKFVHDFWDMLKDIWDGSPAVEKIKNARTSFDESSQQVESETNSFTEETESGFDLANNENFLEEETQRGDLESDFSSPSNSSIASVESEKSKASTAKFVDDKRKLMEKNLSSNQRDHLFLKIAKDDLVLKQNLLNELTKSADESNKVLEKMSDSMTKIGDTIGNGLSLLANAIAGTAFNAQPTQIPFHQHHPYQPPSTQFTQRQAPNIQGHFSNQRFDSSEYGFSSNNGRIPKV